MIEIDDKLFIAALNHIAALPEGQVFFAVLKDSCQWDKTYLASDNPQTSHYYAVKRGVYGGIRQHIRAEYLKKIEFDYIRKVATNDRPATITVRRPATSGKRPNK